LSSPFSCWTVTSAIEAVPELAVWAMTSRFEGRVEEMIPRFGRLEVVLFHAIASPAEPGGLT
jgi:hypothetical protein